LNLEARAVVALEQFGHQMRRRVTMEIGREITDLEFPTRTRLRPPMRECGLSPHAAGPTPRHLQL
jgi:hypothetical protein